MTRILITSDWHVDTVTAGTERFAELAEYVSALEEVIREESVDLVCNLGDCWDPGTVQDPRWARFVYSSFAQLGAAAKHDSLYAREGAGLVAIPGNHDVIDTSIPTSTLSALAALNHETALVLEKPSLRTMAGVAVLALPYVARAYQGTPAYQRALDDALEASLRASRDMPLIVIGHLSFDNMHPGSEIIDMSRGREIPFPVELVEQLDPAAVFNGHYHMRQRIRRGGLDIEIPGSPIQFTFGETKDGPRGFLIVEV